jgi:alpha-galactosidase
VGDKVIVTMEPVKALSEVDGRPVEFVVTASNDGVTAFAGKLVFEANGVTLSPKGGALALKVGAGQTVTKRVVLQPAAAKELTLRAVSADARVLGRDFCFNPPRVLRPVDGKAVAVEVNFMANKLLEASLVMKGTTMEISGRVIDTAIKIEERTPWTGSTIELFVRQARTGALTKQFFLLPRTRGAAALDRSLTPSKTTTCKVAIDKGGYDFTVRCDLAKAGVQAKAGDPFYLDLIISAGALGDAHGACRVGWNGKTTSSTRSAHFALIAPE